MKVAPKNLIRAVLPPGVRRWWRLRFGWQWFRGDYASWAAARAASGGYDDAAVLARVLAATRAARLDPGSWERDGVVFKDALAHAPLLAALQIAAQDGGGRLDVVDFGGALGSTWWQHRVALSRLARVRWAVVEQSHYVAAGREFADDVLGFHASLADALTELRPQVVLLSGVLPYIESPQALLEDIVARGFEHVILDRTPLVASGRRRLAVQHTPAALGGGSYPCWLRTDRELLAPLYGRYRLVEEWPALDDLAADVRHRGFHFRRA